MQKGQIAAGKSTRHRVVIVGGGLTGCLIALALNAIDPGCDFLLIEQSSRLGGRDIPPFFASDVADEDRAMLLDDIIVSQWPLYYVATPDFCGEKQGCVALVDPLQLHAEIFARISASKIMLGIEVVAVEGRRVLSTFGAHEADTVIDARPHPASYDRNDLHLSTFDVAFKAEHPLPFPVLIDDPLQTSTGSICMQYFPRSANKVTVRSLGYGAYDVHPIVLANAAKPDLRIEHMRRKVPPSWADGALRTPRYGSHPLLPSPVPAAAATARWLGEALSRAPLGSGDCAALVTALEGRFAKTDDLVLDGWQSHDGPSP